MRLTNKLNLPSPFVRAVEAYERKYKKSLFGHISTTTLIKPPQIRELTKRYYDQIEEDVSGRLFALQGQIIHAILEAASDDTVLTENRVGTTINGVTLTGQYDLIEDQILHDYKYISVWSYIYGADEWELQSNVNRYLLYKNGIEIKGLKNILLFRDFTASKAGKGNYPKTPAITVGIDMWTIEQAESYIKERLKLFDEASRQPDEKLIKCSDQERWYDQRKKIFRKCEKFCSVNKFCKQYNKEEE